MVFIIILATFPILALGGLTISLLDISHRHDVSNLELLLIDEKIKEIEKFFADTLGILEIRVAFPQKSEIELSQQSFLLDGLLEENRAFEEVSFIGLSGRETAKKTRFEGKIELLDVSRLEKFREVADGKNYIGSVYYTLSGPMITLSAPVRNRNDDIIQVLSAEVNLSQITRSIKNAGLGTSGYLVLLDRDGALIAHRSQIDVRPGADLSGLNRVERVLAGGVLDGLKADDRYESFFGRVPVVGAGKKIQRIGWALLAEWPINDADSIIGDVRNQIVLFTILGIFAVLLLAPLFVVHLVQPIQKLKAGVRKIEKGDFETRVQIKTGDELEDLGSAFNKMTKGLKRLEELRNEFVFIAAHELRAPVTVIKGYVSMILEGDTGPVPSKAQEYLSLVMKSSEGLEKLVSDMLEVARSEAGRIEIEVVPTDISEQVKAVLQELKILADEKSIQMIYDPPSDLPKILADSAKLKEVIKNLVDNAVKYTVKPGTITVSHQIKENRLLTNVQDTGVGISTENQKKLFQKFYRIKAEETQGIRGTGLGLWIIKQLIEKMNGEIWVKSREGEGSTFSFSLPIA